MQAIGGDWRRRHDPTFVCPRQQAKPQGLVRSTGKRRLDAKSTLLDAAEALCQYFKDFYFEHVDQIALDCQEFLQKTQLHIHFGNCKVFVPLSFITDLPIHLSSLKNPMLEYGLSLEKKQTNKQKKKKNKQT